MTDHRDLKKRIRERKAQTDERYTVARAHVMRERAALLALPSEAPSPVPIEPVDAVVLKVNRQSARVRILGEDGQVTVRSRDVWEVVPGHIVTLVLNRRWTWRGSAYASGKIKNPRIDLAKLDLEPLPLVGGELEDVASYDEPYHAPDPYAPLWRKLSAKPRPAFEFDGIAWGALPGRSAEDNPTCDAAELTEAGDHEGARELLMEALCTDLRCVDAHAHLGNLVFDHWPERALTHYEMGIRIGELSLPPGFDGLLVWGRIYSRPFLRCLHGYGLCLWRLSNLAEAQRVFERILSMNPNDNQGVRFCWAEVCAGKGWQEMHAREEAERVQLLSQVRRR